MNAPLDFRMKQDAHEEDHNCSIRLSEESIRIIERMLYWTDCMGAT